MFGLSIVPFYLSAYPKATKTVGVSCCHQTVRRYKMTAPDHSLSQASRSIFLRSVSIRANCFNICPILALKTLEQNCTKNKHKSTVLFSATMRPNSPFVLNHSGCPQIAVWHTLKKTFNCIVEFWLI